MTSQEIPQREDEMEKFQGDTSLSSEAATVLQLEKEKKELAFEIGVKPSVDKMKDTRAISPHATEEALLADIYERTSETGLTEDDKSKIETLKKSMYSKDTDFLIHKALQGKDTGDEKYVDISTPQEKQERSERMSGLRRIAAVFGITLAGATMANKATAMENNPEDSSAAKKTEKVISQHENSAEFTTKLRTDWNDLVDWIGGLGLTGSESLDHNNLGKAMVERYVREHPGTSVSLDMIEAVQVEMQKYRQWALEEVHAGRKAFGPGVTEANFMTHISKIDGIPGQFTLQTKFPKEYLLTLGNTIDYNIRAIKSIKDVDGRLTDVVKRDGSVKKIDEQFSKRDDVNNMAKK